MTNNESKNEYDKERASHKDSLVTQALQWVRDHPEIRDCGVNAVNVKGLALPDALAADPKRIMTAIEAIIGEAKEQDAPSDVISGLESSLAKMKEGAKNLKSYEYTLHTLASMKGLRDRFELEPILKRALADAPDDCNREKLEMMYRVVTKPEDMRIDLLELDLVKQPLLGIKCDWGCCAFTCVLCWSGCLVCCAAACLLCSHAHGGGEVFA